MEESAGQAGLPYLQGALARQPIEGIWHLNLGRALTTPPSHP